MSQHDFNIANQGFPATRGDLNNALAALASSSSGTSEPSTTYAGQVWTDTTNNLLKFRNDANDGWITFAKLDQATNEWEVRSSVFQAVDSAGIAFKTDDGTTRLTIDSSGNLLVGTTDNFPGLGDTNTGFSVLSDGRVGASTADDFAMNLNRNSSDGSILNFCKDGTTVGSIASQSSGSQLSIETGSSQEIRVSASGALTLEADREGDGGGAHIDFRTAGSEAMRIDSSGNLLVGTTDTNPLDNTSGSGMAYDVTNGNLRIASADTFTAGFNRIGSDGPVAQLRKNGTAVGTIGVFSNTTYMVGGSSRGIFLNDNLNPSKAGGANSDNIQDIGQSNRRWDDVYATNGTIQTSDRNEKQDIAELDEAEQRVAVACKGLLRKYRWKDAVAEKGDDARIHVGIIAQDLQDAFAAEGLDAGRYAMFISSTWWETQTEVPAVEAQDEVLDEDGNVIQEAVEAEEAYTRTDTYDTAEEAPAGATERTRLGVRYPELLAFIISAL